MDNHSYYYNDQISQSFNETYFLKPSPTGTALIISSLVVAFIFSNAESAPSEMAKVAATVIGTALVLSALFDLKQGLRNLFRTDLMCLISLYFLTIFEFLLPQEGFDSRITLVQTGKALYVIYIAFFGLAVGRHLVAPKPMKLKALNLSNVANKTLFTIFFTSAFLGYLHILLAVDFDILRMLDEMMRERFAQSWGRGRLGDWNALLSELGLLRSVIPPLFAVILNRRSFCSKIPFFIASVIFGFVIFHNFSSGSRNLYVADMATFLLSYLLTLPKNTFRNTLIPIIVSIFLVMYGSYHMLEFRTIGLRAYLDGEVYKSEQVRDTIQVDLNLAPLGLLVDGYAKHHDYLGSEVIIWSLVKPIPRALWPGKPEGLSVSIEESVGAGQGYTVATTYIGESYMMAGHLGVLLMSLFFGGLAAWWNRLAFQKQSDYAMVVYALGFFASVIVMRSMFWLTTMMLPIVALIVFKKNFLKN